MDFRLKVFISVARNLSFTNASKELQISQPAITKHIQELEAYYGVKLFARRGSRIELTAEGELMLKHAQSITDAYSLVKSDIALGKTSFSGQMSIAICNELLPKVAGELLPAFLERFPEVEFNILSGREESVEKAVEEGRAELAFVKGTLRAGLQYDVSVANLGLGYIATQPGKETGQAGAFVLVARLLCAKC